MNAIDFVVRTPAGATERGSVGGENQGFLIDAGQNNDISLNIAQSDLRGYDRAADDLLITLADGRVIVLEGYFASDGNRVFLSSSGQLNQVSFVESENGALFAQYGPTETWGKWSPSDELIFVEEPRVVAASGYDGEEEVSMLGAGLLGLGGMGAATGAGLAGLTGLALLGAGGGDGNGGDGDAWVAPTVDNPDGAIAVGGSDAREFAVTGTANEGSEVTITIGGETVITSSGEDGKWEAVFTGEDFPDDGNYGDYTVVVTDPNGTITELDGPTVEIDTTPPDLTIDTGVVSTGDLFNGETHQGGVTFGGTAEIGSTVVVTIGAYSETITIDDSGTWSVTVDETVLPGGEYLADVTVTATDSFGNVTTVTDQIDIDTVPHPISIDAVTGDDLVNGAEAEGGFEITGTSTAGATVTVTFGGITRDVVVADDGTWSVSVTQSDFDPGEYDADITVTTVDRAGNTSSTTSTIQIDTVNEVTLTNTPLTGDDVISDGEMAAGVTLTGTSQAGSTVSVVVEGVTKTATVGADGTWSVTYASGDLPGGTYDTTASISSTDPSGNVVTTTYSFSVDTEAALTINTAGVETDGIVNAVERADGVVLTGSGEAGAAVAVTVAGTVMDTTVGADGVWTVTIPTALVPEGTTSLPVSAVSTDAAGNTATAAGTIAIDTETSVDVTTAGVAGDGVVNAAEHPAGVTLTGWAEAGSTVMVTLGGVTHQATLAANGSWSVSYTAAELPTGETTLDVTASSTDPAGNTATATGTLDIDTLVTNFASTSTPGGSDGVINAAEAAAGLTLTGTTEVGSTVTVTFDGISRAATVDAQGNWSVTYASSELPMGERTVTMTATARDAAGNTDTLTQEVRVDTDAGLLTISPAPVEGDDIVNFAEASDGVTLTGTSTPFQMVDVTMNGVSVTVQTDASGIWRAPFAANQVAPGTYTADITATITDSAGNTLTRTDSVQVDTEVLNFATSVDPITDDNVINHAERLAGVTLSGTTEAGGSVQIVIDGTSHGANVDAAGNWSIVLGAAELPEGETSLVAQVQTTDSVGNTAETAVTLNIDTVVRVLSTDTGPVAGDNIVNAEEAMAGFTMTGAVEPGSSVTLAIGTATVAATVAADGTWSADIPPQMIPTGSGSLDVVISATDAAGNTDSITQTLGLDTEAPDTLNWVGYGRDGTGVDQIRTEISADDVYIGQLAGTDTAPMVLDVALADSTDIPALGQTYHTPTSTIPDGTHLVLTSTDAAGNTSGAYLVTDDPSTNAVRMSDEIADALGSFQIDTIDLHFAEDSMLTITEAQITALSTTTDTVTIEGGGDDAVSITGAQAQGSNGSGYNVFTLGDATLLIDDEITNVDTGVII